VFGIADNPVVRGEVAARPICDWHVAVFERLFADLVGPGRYRHRNRLLRLRRA
jgi:divinyl protochlorophyllide a 8-vinyl-reductase